MSLETIQQAREALSRIEQEAQTLGQFVEESNDLFSSKRLETLKTVTGQMRHRLRWMETRLTPAR